jgi:uncharacterized protein YdeI (YjbR/CyaY-like superfamily)
MNDESAESYLEHGCGRCGLFKTPECKVRQWTPILESLRALLLASSLTEEMKWGAPCYTLEGKNVAMLFALKRCCGISFFKGVMLGDEGLLVAPGPNSRRARQVEFGSIEALEEHREELARLIERACELERAGVDLELAPHREPMPEELERRLASDPDLACAFDELTPGRQRSHILYVSGARKSDTRSRRAERCVPKIIQGKGFNER